MSAEIPSFSRATYAPATTQEETAFLADPISPSTDTALLARAMLFGLGGAVAGAVLYGGFIHLTHINIGYLSIVVAYLVAKAMTLGSGERGGRPFQISAIVLTCLSIAMGNALMAYWSVRADGPFQLNAYTAFRLLRFGFLEPFYEFQQSAASALLTLFILFIGLRAAWRMTSGVPGAIRHPFSRGF